MSENKGIELINSIASNELSSGMRNLGEVALDTILQEGILRDIPVLNTIVAFYKAGVEIHHQLFLTKIINFLKELSNTPLEKREKFVEEIKRNPTQEREFEKTLLLLIDRADSLQKPSILGKLLKHHILGNISYEDATRLSYMVDRVYISDLSYLLNFNSGVQRNQIIAASLQSIGLLSFAGIDGGTLGEETSSGGVSYELNEYASMLLRYGLEDTIP
jgi:hypothetical protein